MISGGILLVHFIFLVFIFIKFFREENLSSALLNVIFILVIFAVGWTFWAFIVNLIFTNPPQGKEINKDSVTLILLTISELFFYKIYYADKFIGHGKEKQ